MSEQNSIQELFRRAVLAQIELGTGEVVITKNERSQARASRPQAAIAQAVESSDIQQAGLFTAPEEAASFASLDEHFEAICNCQLCPLGKTRNKFVYGVGNPKAKVMFIGEGPGADEDAKGEPFVGRAGQLLDKILAAIQFTRQDVYIANIVKCRPPSNRVPTAVEMETCFPYLQEQIRLIKPRLLCALGKTAATALLGESPSLGKMRGFWHHFKGIPTIVTYHPAALLRDPAYKKGTWEDMQMLRARYEKLPD